MLQTQIVIFMYGTAECALNFSDWDHIATALKGCWKFILQLQIPILEMGFVFTKQGNCLASPQFWRVLRSKATLLCSSVWCQGTCNSFFLLPEVRN